MKQIGLKDYQSIKTPEDYEYERCVQNCYNELCDDYADEIAEQGMKWQNRMALLNRARKMARARMAAEYEETEEEEND